MQAFIQNLINGLALGGVYALVALGYTMVYGILQFINFAHSEIFMLGAFAGLFVAVALQDVGSTPVVVTAVVFASMAACMAVGALVERLAYRPLRSAPRLNVLITAVGVSLLLQNAAQILWGATPRVFPTILETQPLWQGTELVLTNVQLIVIVVSAVLVFGLSILVNRTKLGMAMRAVSFDFDVSSLMGIPTDRIIVFTFMIGCSLAGCASILYGISYPKIEPMMGVVIGMKAFVAAVFGGIGSLTGAAVGGLVLGLSESFTIYYVSSTFRDAIAFAILILVLLLRPSGLFGVVRKEKV
ncbi:branched-chain amino acid ABC transporter permease [bacterium]|nr:branched-chain amino acid ABC transporter permease [bacterium]